MTAIAGQGTSEEVWLPHLDLPALDLPWPERAVVVAPHPDDEVLGVGGLACLLAAAGVRVEVVAVTDGERSHPAEGLAERRTAESARACALLGVEAPRRLGLPDGGCELLEDPVAALVVGPDDWVLATWEGDGHPDHEAVGRGARRAAERGGARFLPYPVWTWHWGTPGDERVPWERLRRVDLPAEVVARKAAAVTQFTSQFEGDAPILPPHVLARFARPFEVVFA